MQQQCSEQLSLFFKQRREQKRSERLLNFNALKSDAE